MENRESRIRARAHQMWEDEGRPENQDQRHWEAAEKAIDEEDRGGATQVVTPEEEDRATALKAADGREPVVGGSVSETSDAPKPTLKAPKRASRRRSAPPPVDSDGERPVSRH
jgi:hypothetical protein